MGGQIIFNRQSGGLGRPLASTDQYSGLIFYTASLPSGFSASERIKKIYSLQEAENLGIVDTYTDETKATGGSVLITAAGAAGTVSKISIANGLIGSYTVVTSNTPALVAAGLVAAINANSFKTGWTATLSTATVVLVPPKGLGSFINSSGITFVNTGVGAATVKQFSSGASSFLAVMHYQISEFFRVQPQGVLWLGLFAVPTTFDGAEIKTMQDFAEGQIKQIGLFVDSETFAASLVTSCQSVADTLQAEDRPLSIILTADFTGITTANLTNNSSLDSERVSVIIGMDGNWNMYAYSNTKSYIIGDKVKFLTKVYVCKQATIGNSPYEGTYWTEISENLTALSGYTVACLGACLGATALASVFENIGWVEKFNVTSGNILSVAGLVTGDNFVDLTLSTTETLENYHYIFLRSYDGIAGVRFNDSWTCTLSTSDYATIENVRTMDKAIRNIRVNELPLINSPLYVNKDGTLDNGTISRFKNEARRALEQMEIQGEISAYKVLIGPTQNVLQSSTIVISIEIVPVGAARTIVNNIGYVVSVN